MQMIKRTLSILMTVVMLVSVFSMVNVASAAVWDGTAATAFAAGSGTLADPYIIMNAEQFAYMRDCVNNDNANYGAAHYVLGADITLNENVLDDEYNLNAGTFKDFGSIGSSDNNPFKGSFDGAGHTISGYKAGSGTALFRYAGGELKNFKLVDAYQQGWDEASLLVEQLSNTITIKNVTIDGRLNLTGNDRNIGFFVASVRNKKGNVTIEDCVAKGVISGTSGGTAGSFIGGTMSINNTITITNCVNYAKITSKNTAGGFIGNLASANWGAKIYINDCINYGEITAVQYAGGFVGKGSSTSSLNMTRCLNEGAVSGGTYAGGMAGHIYQVVYTGKASFSFNNVFNAATVTSAEGTVGALLGGYGYEKNEYAWTVSNAYYLEGVATVDAVASASATRADLQSGSWLGGAPSLWVVEMGKNPILALVDGEGNGSSHTHVYLPSTSDASCTVPGSTVYTCECGDSYTVEGEPLGHDYVGTQTTDPTCDDAGEMTYVCSRCDDTYTEAVEALGHDYVGTTTKNPTCEEEGETTYDCSRCDASYTEAIDTLDHEYTNGYCDSCGAREIYTPISAEWDIDFVDDNENEIDAVSVADGDFWMVVRLTNYEGRVGEMVNTGDITTSTYDRTVAVATVFAAMNNTQLSAVYENDQIVYTSPYKTASIKTNYDLSDGMLKIIFQSDDNAGCTFSIGATDLDANNGELFRIKVQSQLTKEGAVGVQLVEETAQAMSSVALVNKPEEGEWFPDTVYTAELLLDSRCYDSIYEMKVVDGDVHVHEYTVESKTDATCTEDGTIVYTCTCGDSYTETIPATGHDYVDGTCGNCGEADPDVPQGPTYVEGLAIYGCSTIFQSDYSVRVYVKNSTLEGYTSVKLVAKKAIYDATELVDYETVEITNPTVNASYHLYDYTGFAAREIASDIELYIEAVDAEGNAVYGPVKEYSLREYALNQITKTDDAKFRTMMVDFLNYGAAAQQYFEYNMNAPANAGTEEYQQYATEAREYVSHKDGLTDDSYATRIIGASLVFKNKVNIRGYVSIKNENIDDIMTNWYGEATYVGADGETKTKTIDLSTMTKSSGYYVFSFDNLYSKEMSTPVNFTLYNANGEQMSNTAVYSIESYVVGMSSMGETIKNLSQTLIKFGDSAKAYLTK